METVRQIPTELYDRIRRNNCLVRVSVRQCQFTIRAYLPENACRKRVEQYISDIFHKQYRACVHDFQPLLITIENNQDDIIAALGIRFADHQRLFAEDYTHRDMESLLTQNFEIRVDRKHMIEIGNLASSHAGYAKFLFVAMTRILTDWHFRWLAFTAVPAVINVFSKLKLNPVEVCRAHLEDLTISHSDWGEYYQHRPRVMLGDILSASRFLENQGSYQRINFQWVEEC